MDLTIPKALKELPLWTLSDNDKKPISPKAYYKQNPWGWSPTKSKEDPLLTYKEVITHLERIQRPGWLPALRLVPDIGYIITDVEPEGMQLEQANKYEFLPYVYLEYSKNNGLHGILPFQPQNKDIYDKLTVIKDNPHHTEIMIHNHFLTFSGKQIEIDELDKRYAIATSESFQKQFETFLRGFIVDVDENYKGKQIDSLFEQPLTRVTQALMLKGGALIKPFTMDVDQSDPSKDYSRSALEFRKYCEITHFCLDQKPELSLDDLTSVVYQLAKRKVPYRPKHEEPRHHSQYGTLTFKELDILNAINYVLSIR